MFLKKLNSLRLEADAAIARAEDAEAQVKLLQQDLLAKEQEITSLQHRLGVMETENDKTEARLQEFKTSSLDSEHTKTTAENLSRKVQLLEEELDKAEKNVKETVEKYVAFAFESWLPSHEPWWLIYLLD